jgi:hypothetical protein
LFNDTLGYNIGYGIKSRQLADATQEQIEEAVGSIMMFFLLVELTRVVGEGCIDPRFYHASTREIRDPLWRAWVKVGSFSFPIQDSF